MDRGHGQEPASKLRTSPLVLLVILCVFGLLSAACTTGAETVLPGAEQPAAAAEATEEQAAPEVAVVDPVPALLASMTVEQKIGQLLMPMVWGTSTETTAEERRLNLEAHGFETGAEIVAAYDLGGVVYLAANVSSASDLQGLSAQLQSTARQDTGIGLLLAIDQEGGQVARLTDEVTSFPAAAEFAGDPQRAKEAGYVTGQQVQQQGINVVLAPVADVIEAGQGSFIGDRSFGSDPAAVADMVAASVQGLQDSGVAAAVKHWPGHGATRVDSHDSLPTLDVDRQLWDQRERVPFDAAIAQDVAIVMVGHLSLPQLDPTAAPATVSPVLVDQLLRQELGFDGVVMTDALNMGAVKGYDRGELAVASVRAGVDIILVPPSLSAASGALIQAANEGQLPAEQLDAAVTRVLGLKHDLGLLPLT